MRTKPLLATCGAGVMAGWLALFAAPAATAAATADPHQFQGASTIIRADDLIGRLVETRDGVELGRVRDIAIDLDSGRIGYVAISVGSFLIDDSLVAVDPRALRPSADADGRLVLEADAESLRTARRFGGREWPLRADIVAGTARPTDAAPDAAAGAADGDGALARGTAVISDGNRVATLSAGARSIRPAADDELPVAAGDALPAAAGEELPAAAGGSPAPASADIAPPRSAFDRLDRTGTGALDRTQMAHELRPGDRYSDIDTNGDGLIQRSEYETWAGGGSGGAPPSE